MGCGAGKAIRHVRTESGHFICKMKAEETEDVIIQPLGVFGENAFPVKVNYDTKKGKAFALALGRIYFSGGDDNPTEFGEFEIFFIVKKASIVYHSSMLCERAFHQIVCINDNTVMALGGMNRLKEGFLKSCEIFNEDKNAWITVADMPLTKCGMGTAAFGGKYLYTFGGYISTRNVSTSIECYDITSNTWTTVGVMGDLLLKGHGKLACQVDPQTIMVFGSEHDDGTIPTYSFDVSKKELKKIDQAEKIGSIRVENPIPISYCKGRIYAIEPSTLRCFVYSVKKECWGTVRMTIN